MLKPAWAITAFDAPTVTALAQTLAIDGSLIEAHIATKVGYKSTGVGLIT
jgi:hypothetical protein